MHDKVFGQQSMQVGGWAVVVAQLVELSLPTTENPVIGKFYLLLTVLKDENKEKEAGNGPFLSR